MKNNNIFLLFLLVLHILASPQVSSAQESVEEKPFILTYDLPALFYPDKTGPYDKLFLELQSQNLISGWRVLPPRRTRRDFKINKNSCLTPVDQTVDSLFNIPPENLVNSTAFNKSTGVLIFKTDHPAIRDDKILETTQVGTVNITDFYGLGGKTFKKIDVPTYKKLIELFEIGRFEAIYFILPDVNKTKEVKQIFEDPKFFKRILWQGDDAIICHASQKENLAKITDAIEDLKKSGKLKEFFQEMYNLP